jgi:hypothetical protein
MEQKTFKNLSSEYKKYLKEIENVLINYNVNEIYKFSILNKYYNDINAVNTELLIVEKDIDNLINSYEKSDQNETINKLKSLLKQRNSEIIRNLLKSSIYQNYLEKLYIDNNKKISKTKIDQVMMEIIKKYAMSWKCCWSFLNLDESGNIKNMELFDLNDINFYNEKINECKKSKKI